MAQSSQMQPWVTQLGLAIARKSVEITRQHLAWTGFYYHAREQRLRLVARPGQWFVSTGDAWGTATLRRRGGAMELCLHNLGGAINVREVVLQGWGQMRLPRTRVLRSGSKVTWRIARQD